MNYYFSNKFNNLHKIPWLGIYFTFKSNKQALK